MKFKYRGIDYESCAPATEVIEGEVGGQYRGTSWKHHYPRHIPTPQPVVGLKYRGVSYSSGHPIDVEANILRRQYEGKTVAKSTPEQKSTISNRQKVLAQLNLTHTANIRQNLEHRLQVARARGDQKLVQMLEIEANQLIAHN
ncbi:DUF4278 domain-containing protein [Gloeocapsopsis dulcis]|uniref:DUF4278 domain-containing protein n=1 Tax=Gloeocapsopsis dulcis AAB1 = 1H9 TaxID=1433147 RepID=A0A6N8FZT9_9CHRO|nr:DUF4278 domain-containing protein [Gloeocapsopsis dulcis]MUL38379.1 hypothetical protein [Gloeocapsopsis dulcis AAB1 = 1H9]WNN91578.1 DUF4278 domain-containing protein [Gloeocapsopsis dulcis]